ncbi:hypothetical protein NDU88_003586 [Pleurodeles waltl]|uniref:Secreted protein n=1 Tax=Pleurodeles waltl TaxID=8319 RepID=A0AAV7VEM4_PLEWA|nr:hypothetical protein NDU88_003586 [Pleurodeles waltl]
MILRGLCSSTLLTRPAPALPNPEEGSVGSEVCTADAGSLRTRSCRLSPAVTLRVLCSPFYSEHHPGDDRLAMRMRGNVELSPFNPATARQ